MTNKYLICLDLDGTLLRDDKTISEETKKYLLQLENKGHYICLTSGRPTYNVKRYYDEIGLKTSPIISFNGHLALNLNTNTTYIEHYFAKDEVLNLYKKLEENNLGKVFLAMNQSDIFITQKDIHLLSFFSSSNVNVHIDPDLEKIFNADKVYNIVFSLNQFEDKETVIKIVDENYPNLNPRFWGDFPISEVYKNGVSKSLTIDELAKILNIDQDHIIIFGDAQNDYEMLKNHKNSYVMKNGLERLKTVAAHVTKFSNNEDGVIKELKTIIS